jgi:hypothetical protein
MQSSLKIKLSLFMFHLGHTRMDRRDGAGGVRDLFPRAKEST